MNFGREDFCQWGKKKLSFVSTPYNPSREQGDMKMLTLIILLRVLSLFVLKVYCFQQFQSQMLILLQILLSSRLMKFLKNFATFTSGLVNQLMLRMSLQIFLLTCQKKKYQNFNYWLEGKTITNSGITTRKELLQPQKLILFWPTGGWADMWSFCQNISELSFNNPDLPTLKYFQTMEMEATNQFFELMKKKHRNFVVISECGLYLDKTNCFIGGSPDCLMSCRLMSPNVMSCCEDACFRPFNEYFVCGR